MSIQQDVAIECDAVTDLRPFNRTTAQREVFEGYLVMWQFVLDQKSRLDFNVVRIVGRSPEDGRRETRIFERYVDGEQDWDCNDPAAAQLFLTGDVRSDGQSYWDFPIVDRGMIQFGNSRDATGLGRLMQRIHEIAAGQLVRFDDPTLAARNEEQRGQRAAPTS
jgi:hypothetical protein